MTNTQPQAAQFPRYALLGLPVNALSKQDLVDLAGDAIARNKRYVIANHNMHGIYLTYDDPRMREFFAKADFVHLDGMALVWLGRVFGLPFARKDRTTYVDFMPAIMERAARDGWRISYLGSKPEVAEKGAEMLRQRYPGLQIQVQSGYFDPSRSSPENHSVLENIRAYQPNVLLVGMGMPRQEMWLLENLEGINANAVYCCGAMMDYLTGNIPTPPRWMGQIGFEWLYRLLSEPNRLWRRYLVEPWTVLGIAAKEFLNPARRNPSTGGADR
jgi:N-acetylglucosaminyldiphosphoundecaprenol N-acetyl-beta-D-mannosaminyltransferase